MNKKTVLSFVVLVLLVFGMVSIPTASATLEHPEVEVAAIGGTTCGNAPRISTLPYSDSGDTNAGTQNNVNTYPTLPPASYGGNEIVYRFVADASIDIEIIVTGVPNVTDMMIGVGTGCSNAQMIANSGDFIDDVNPERVLISGVAPGTYYIVIDHWSASPGYPRYGPYTISVTGTGIVAPTVPPVDGGGDGAVEVVPGCDVSINVPSTAVGAKITAETPVYWMPGEETEHVLPAGTSVIALGPDSSGAYFKIVYVCDYLWVPSGSIGPNPEYPWNGALLPTTPVN